MGFNNRAEFIGPLGTDIVTGDIRDDEILDEDINSAAGILHSKMESDARARANHTGTQTASTVSDFASVVGSSTSTFTNKTLDANGTGNSVTNIDLTADVINDLPVTEGGTGASDAATGLSNLGGIGAATTDTFTNKTLDANGTGNSVTNIDVADLANGTDGELITWDANAAPATVAVGTVTQVLTSNGVGAAPTFQAAAGGPAQATQAAIEAETNEDTYAPPDLLRHHPGVAKCYGTVNSSGTLQANSFNVASVTKPATGDYLITVDTDFANTNYVVQATAEIDASDRIANVGVNPTVGTFKIKMIRGNGALINTPFSFVCFGDQ